MTQYERCAAIILALSAPAGNSFKNTTGLKDSLPLLVAAFNWLTADGAMTVRDPRMAVLARIGGIEDPSTGGLLRRALEDRDPAIAAPAKIPPPDRSAACSIEQIWINLF
jgi:hypothetical protein